MRISLTGKRGPRKIYFPEPPRVAESAMNGALLGQQERQRLAITAARSPRVGI